MWRYALDHWQISNRIVPFLLIESRRIILERWGFSQFLIHLLLQSVVILIVLFKIYDYNGDVISAIVISATLIRNLFSYFYQVITINSHFVYFLCQLFIIINQEQSIRRKDQEIIIFLKLIMIALWIRNEELLKRLISNRPAHSYRAIYTRYSILIGNKAIHVYYPVYLILSFSVLVNGHLGHVAIIFHNEAARVTNICQ